VFREVNGTESDRRLRQSQSLRKIKIMEDNMKSDKAFYRQVNFYVSAAALLFTVIAIALYAGNCASEFNGGAVSQAVVTCDVIAIIAGAVAVAADVLVGFVPEKSVLSEIAGYRRFLKYFAFIMLIGSFFMSILDEYSLLGTILYPIVSGTVGDPVDPTLSASYFTALILTLISCVGFIVSALMQKSGFYKAENNPARTTEEG